jgi:hypothetical protein
VGAEMSLELVSGDGVDVRMSFAVRLPPVGCCPIELVCSEKDLLAISALGDHEFLLDPLEPIPVVCHLSFPAQLVGTPRLDSTIYYARPYPYRLMVVLFLWVVAP